MPDSDSRVLERLPYQPTDPAQQQLRSLRAQLQVQPNNLGLAVDLARRYVELGRTSGDPRYAGYAEAALAPWWSAAQPPTAVRLLRATLLQRQHRFDAALADLDAVLKAQPRHAQARLTRATVLQVQGAFDDARAECLALQPLTQELVSAACLANVERGYRSPAPGYAQLRAVLARHADAPAGIRAWVLTGLAEMALRCAMVREAEDHFRRALLLDPEDSYLLGAYADFLLDQDRPVEAIESAARTAAQRRPPAALRPGPQSAWFKGSGSAASTNCAVDTRRAACVATACICARRRASRCIFCRTRPAR